MNKNSEINELEKRQWWCRSCWQEGECETNLEIGNFNSAAMLAHKMKWHRSRSGRCDKPDLIEKAARIVTPRVKREKSPELEFSGDPIVLR